MSPPSPATARPRAPRLLAIPPPSGAVALACIDAWLDAGAPEAGLAVLLREPGATPAALLDAHGRLAPLRRRCRDLGIPLLLGCDADAPLYPYNIRLMNPCKPENESRRRTVAPDPKQARAWGERQIAADKQALHPATAEGDPLAEVHAAWWRHKTAVAG